MNYTVYRLLFLLGSACFYFLPACSPQQSENDKIDRFALVSRHNVENFSFDTLSSLTVGNGRFAFTVDATGLQTFPELYRNGVPLGTMSEWGWHNFPDTAGFRREETFAYFKVEGRQVPYSVQWNEPERKKNAADYFRANPHRLHLGIVGFELLHPDHTDAAPGEIKNIHQKLDLWTGTVSSSFELNDRQMKVETVSHPEKDKIAFSVSSENIRKGLIGIKLRLPYPTGEWGGDGCNWEKTGLHHSEIIEQQKNSAVIRHTLDTTTCFIRIDWNGNAVIRERSLHEFVLEPGKNQTGFSVSVEFSSKNDFTGPESFPAIKKLSEQSWAAFWKSGGAVDFSETEDPRAKELERRVVLSQYLTRAQCAGNLPPQETGLTYNSWYGKPHLEMHWWHGVQFAFWNRTSLLEKSLDYYSEILEKAKAKAERQGYPGARWPKMTDPSGNDSPSGVGEFLIWQQPHLIYFAELCYRQHPDTATLEKYETLVSATADFMAGFARWDVKNNRYILGPPLIPAQESLEKEKTVNPPFELAYWHWGLSVAQQWQKRMGKPLHPDWQKVIEGFPKFAEKDGLYLAAESAPDSYENPRYYSDHPMVLGAFGILPATIGLDTAIMANTLEYIAKNWNWEKTWGWDYPMAAMCATRLGKPELAVDLLLKNVQKNTYLKNGHNYQDARLRIYLPGNGGLLTAVAMMCAGFEGNTKNNPGFPENWKVKWENLNPVF